MSTNYRIATNTISFDRLKESCPRAGLELAEAEENSDEMQCYTNGEGWVWAYRHRDGGLSFCIYGANYGVVSGLEALAEDLGVTLLSEQDEEYDEA